MHRFSVFLFSVFLFSVFSAQAQPRDRGSFSYLYEGTADIDSGGHLALRELEFRTGYPVWREPHRIISLGLRATRYDFLTSDAVLEDFTTHSLRLPVTAVWPRGGSWSWMAMVAPALRSDFESLSTDDLGLSAMLLATYPWRPDLRLSVGAVYGQDFGRTRLFPALGATWTPSPELSVDLTFPRPRAAYKVSPVLTLTIGIEPGGDQWNIQLDGDSRDLALKEYRAGLGAEWQFARQLALVFQAGHVFGRELELRNERRKISETDIDDTWYARVGLRVQ
ncbi:MAG TPA: DUF6268 family outer membrane beta-barrel protein [Kiritimatiellia bacterium]|nr:DUF6268 family outer membrane beta-barrel protein [Kiritimatiellia bacterium]